MSEHNVEIARAAFCALDRHDVLAFLELCDPEVELFRFTAPTGESHGAEFALVPLRGPEEIEPWFRRVFDSFAGMRFLLEAVDEVGDSVVCDTRVSFGDDRLWQWSFVLTMRDGRILGFEVFHPRVDGSEEAGRHTLAFGQFQVRGKANEVTAPTPRVWVFYKDEEGPYSSVRVYADSGAAREAVKLRP